MDTSQNQQQAVCGKEALDLLNCVAESPYDQEKCLSLLQSLRQCIINKVLFSLLAPSFQQPFPGVTTLYKVTILTRGLILLKYWNCIRLWVRLLHMFRLFLFIFSSQKVKKFSLAEQTREQPDSSGKKQS
ncbi:hypothetical protein Sango_1198600 [Sesamum angolense]|uniref:CHCH domain-containing protein n=1 Tax=Sesamum angolense TaxID=2727404 RepID=A0AAE2BXB6_9LAMI|nr:hypothetical protein Sango_1198600 [Sesamum angolense]